MESQALFFSPEVFLEVWNPTPQPNQTFRINLVVESVSGQEFLTYLWVPPVVGYVPFRINISGYRILAISVIPLECADFTHCTRIILKIAKGSIISEESGTTLLSGYCTQDEPLSYPNYNKSDWLSDWNDVIILTAVAAAGNNFSLALPAGYVYQPMLISYKLITEATAGSRNPRVFSLHGANNLVFHGYHNQNILASQTNYILFSNSCDPNTGVPFYLSSKFNQSSLLGGNVISIGASGLKPLDQLSDLIVRCFVNRL